MNAAYAYGHKEFNKVMYIFMKAAANYLFDESYRTVNIASAGREKVKELYDAVCSGDYVSGRKPKLAKASGEAKEDETKVEESEKKESRHPKKTRKKKGDLNLQRASDAEHICW